MVTGDRVYLSSAEISFSNIFYEQGINSFLDSAVIYIADPLRSAFGTTYTVADAGKEVEIWNSDLTYCYFLGRLSTYPGWSDGFIILQAEGVWAQFSDRKLASYTSTVQDKAADQDQYTGWINALTTTTLTDDDKAFVADAYIGYYCVIDPTATIPAAERFLSIDWEADPVADFEIQAGADDADFEDNGSTWDNNDTIINCGCGAACNPEYRAYFRFPLNVPRGSTIAACNFKVYCATQTNDPEFHIFLIDSDDCPAFPDGAGNEAAYASTATSVAWDPNPAATNTIDITDLVQDFIDRSGYVPGAYIGLKIVVDVSEANHNVELLAFEEDGVIALLNGLSYTAAPADKFQFEITDNDGDTLTLSGFDTAANRNGIMLGKPYYIVYETSTLASALFTAYDHDKTCGQAITDSSKAIIYEAPYGAKPADLILECRKIDGHILRAWIELYYPAEFSFIYDDNGAEPAGWTVTEDANTEVTVEASWKSHNKVVQFSDDSGAGYARIADEFAAQASGTVEFYIGGTTNDDEVGVHLRESGAGKLWVYCAQGGTAGVWKIYDGAWRNIVDSGLDNVPFAANTWYHVRIVFDCATDDYQLYIDGTQVYWNNAGAPDSDFSFSAVAAAFDSIMFNSGTASTAFDAYVDAVDYSWATGYSLNRNQALAAYIKMVYTPVASLAAATSLPADITKFQTIPPAGQIINVVHVKDRYGTEITRAWDYTANEAVDDTITDLPANYVQRELVITTPRLADATIARELADGVLERQAEPTLEEDITLELQGDAAFQPGELVDFSYDGDTFEDYLITRKKYDSHTDKTTLKLVKY
jgi:hypothetical protein